MNEICNRCDTPQKCMTESCCLQKNESAIAKDYNWRSTAFWHSDIEDSVDRSVTESQLYHPKYRPQFLMHLANELRQHACDLEAENKIKK